MKKVTIGKLKRKNYTGIKAFFRKIFSRPISHWVIVKDGKEIELTWDESKKIDRGFEGRDVGFEFIYLKKTYANIITFYPENFRSIYPDFID